MKKICSWICILSLFTGTAALAASKKQNAVKSTSTVRAKVEATGLYDEECYDAYYGCMDQFCISDNENGGSCQCSDKNEKFEADLEAISKKLADANRMRTEEVERIELGAQADVVFNGARKYDAKGNVVYDNKLDEKAEKRKKLLAMFEQNDDEDEGEEEGVDENDIVSKKGFALFKAADAMCRDQMKDSCSKDIKMLYQLYQRQIESDCKGFENSIAKKKAEADKEFAAAEAEVRGALKDSFNAANKYNQGECMVEFRKCMTGKDACGSDWENCVSTVAAENMQNNETVSVAGTKVSTVNKYDITASTYEMLDAKRPICERVLDQCMAVRDKVWDAFLREAAPTIRLAESNVESKFRQSCLTKISKCIQTACKDDIVGKGTATMDACLSRPDMARSFCKNEIDPCERMSPLIWGYVVDKLAAMRVDACTQEVKDCFTDETRCGKDFEKCIGMDYDYLHDICPLDKLVVCKKNNPNFKMDDLDTMLMGFYLNVDNSALDNCQKLVDKRMTEVCGSTTDCNRWASDDTIGTGSLRSQKDGDIYRITGMISFGSIQMGTGIRKETKKGKKQEVIEAGKIDIEEYMENARALAQKVPQGEAILTSIEAELKNIQGTINRTIDMIEQDEKIQWCVAGRDLEQITGKSGEKTTARYPNMLNQIKMQIATAALHQAQENYNNKFNEYLTKATKDASADVAQYVCQMMPVSGGRALSPDQSVTKQLAEPYAITYEVGAGLTNDILLKGGSGSTATGGVAKTKSGQDDTKFISAAKGISSIAGFGWMTLLQDTGKVIRELPTGKREAWATFDRESRVCHFCTSTVTKSCSTNYKKGFLGIGHKDETSCTESDPVEHCEDFKM